MTQAQVRRTIGPPDVTFTVDTRQWNLHGRRYDGAGYLFPRGLSTVLARTPAPSLPAHKFLDLLYAEGRLVRIDAAVGERVEDGRCPDGRPAPGSGSSTSFTPPASYAPFARFATVRIGDSPRRLGLVLGPPDTINRSRDWRAYHPAPLTFEGDDAIAGFSVSADEDAQFASDSRRLVLHRSARGCRIEGLALE